MDGFLKLGEILWKLEYLGPFLVLIILLNIADYITTRKILAAGGYETNRILKWCIEKKIFTPCKIALTLFVVVIIWHYGPRYPFKIIFIGGYICGGYTFIVWNNVRQLCILKQN